MTQNTTNILWSPRPLPVDPELELVHLFDRSAFASFLFERTGLEAPKCAIKHVRYRPGESCTVLYEVCETRGRRRGPSTIYAKSVSARRYPDAETRVMRDGWNPGPVMRTPSADAKRRTVLYEFPNDARLRDIRILADGDRFARKLADLVGLTNGGRSSFANGTFERLRYKPESRLVARYTYTDAASKQHSVAVRFERTTAAATGAAVARRLGQSQGGNANVMFPKPIFVAENGRFSGTEWVNGVKLSTMLKTPEAAAGLAAAAEALAIVHRHRDERLGVRDTASLICASKVSSQELARALASAAPRVEEISRRLTALMRSTSVGHIGFVHGDYHQGQVIIADGRPHVIDLDRAYIGETLADVGNLVGQLELLALRGRIDGAGDLSAHFLSEYARRAGRAVDPARLAVWTGLSLLELATKEFRRLKPDWPDRVTILLERCLQIVLRKHDE